MSWYKGTTKVVTEVQCYYQSLLIIPLWYLTPATTNLKVTYSINLRIQNTCKYHTLRYTRYPWYWDNQIKCTLSLTHWLTLGIMSVSLDAAVLTLPLSETAAANQSLYQWKVCAYFLNMHMTWRTHDTFKTTWWVEYDENYNCANR